MQEGRRLRTALIVTAMVVGTGPWWATGAEARKKLKTELVLCGQTISHSLRVGNNLENCPNDGLHVGKDGITIDLGGHKIDGTGGAGDYGIDNSAGHDQVVIRNGIITGFENGVRLDAATANIVKSMHVQGNTSEGIRVFSSSSNILKRNTLSGNHTGMSLYSSSNNTLKGNTVSGNNFGIDLNFPSNNNTLKGNTASGNVNHGILLNSLSNNTLEGNTASGNGVAGIVLVASSNNNTLKDNTASGNGDAGIVLDSSSNNRLKENRASANDGDGVAIIGGTGNVLKENVAHENGDDGISSNNASLRLVANKTNLNGFLGGAPGNDVGLGINVPAGTSNGKNRAKGNDDPNQCEASDVNCHVP